MLEENATPEEKELTAEYVAGLTMEKDAETGEFAFSEEKFSAVPLEEKERITSALHAGDLTDEMLIAAAQAAAEAAPVADDADKPADDEQKPAPEPEPEAVSEPEEVDPRDAIIARKSEIRSQYNQDVAALKADIEAAEPEDKYSDEWDEWSRKRNAAITKRADLRDQLDEQLEKAETETYAEVSARTAGSRASASIGKLLASDDLFKGRIAVTDIHKTVESVYRPWLSRLVKANGGDPKKQDDINAAWARFQKEPEFAKSPEVASPDNLKDVLIAVTAYDGVVSRGLAPEAALIDSAIKNGVYGDWRAAAESERKARHEADLKAQAASTTAALARKGDAAPPAATGSGPLSPTSSPEPTDIASAQEWMAAYFARKDAAIARGREYKMSKEEAALHAAAEEIITRESLPGAA